MYLITFKTSGKSYVWISSKSAAYRWKCHIKPCNKFPLGQAFKKYGVDDATLTILAECDSWEKLCAMEIATIAEHNTLSPHGYNATFGGKRGRFGIKHTAEALAKMSKQQKLRLASPEVRAAMSEVAKRRWASPEAQIARSKYADKVKQQWAVPSFMEKMLASRKISHNKPEFKAAQRAKSKLQFSTPEALAAMKARLKIAKNTPEYKTKTSLRAQAQAKRMMADPLARVKILSAMAIGHAKMSKRPFSYIPQKVT